MTTELKVKIEHGVPLPTWGRKGKPGQWAVIAARMKPGDSVLVGNKGERGCLYRQIVQQHGAGSARSVLVDGVGYRVWRAR